MQECSGGHPVSDIAYWMTISHERIPISALLASYPGGPEMVERDRTLITLMMLRRALWMLVADRDRGKSDQVGTHVRALEDALATL
jgi:tRNA(Met) C34 N-acetyltransferase TmcA